jgi:hypothetical protein
VSARPIDTADLTVGCLVLLAFIGMLAIGRAIWSWWLS